MNEVLTTAPASTQSNTVSILWYILKETILLKVHKPGHAAVYLLTRHLIESMQSAMESLVHPPAQSSQISAPEVILSDADTCELRRQTSLQALSGSELCFPCQQLVNETRNRCGSPYLHRVASGVTNCAGCRVTGKVADEILGFRPIPYADIWDSRSRFGENGVAFNAWAEAAQCFDSTFLQLSWIMESCALFGIKGQPVYSSPLPIIPCWTVLIYFGVVGVPNPLNLGTIHLPSALSTASSSAMGLARYWMKTCTAKHGDCGQPLALDHAELPTRILDLGHTPSDIVTLCESRGRRGRYLCLTYCWGTADFTMTTPDTLESHQKGIQISDLPQTFQDAIHIARELGIRYVWIDALCIIQKEDGQADWKRESDRMANIYRNSYLTVAAAWTDTANGGCFVVPEPGVVVGSVLARRMNHFPKSPSQLQDPVDFPLLTRAWTYQERMLSPRILYFGRNELLWDCQSLRTCECGGAQRHGRYEVSRSEFRPHFNNGPASKDEAVEAHRIWRQMVMQYSPLRLSYPDDKLPAMSGLANVMQRRIKQEYLAGLWKDTLIADMCWYRPERESGEKPCHIPWRAPTWSWASVDGPVLYHGELVQKTHRKVIHETYERPAHVLGAECALAGPSHTGQVIGGFVDLHCYLIPTSVREGKICVDGFVPLNLYYDSDERYGIDECGEYYLIPMLKTLNGGLGLVVRRKNPQEMIRIGLVEMYRWDYSKSWPGQTTRQTVRIV